LWPRRILNSLKQALPKFRWDGRFNDRGGYLFADSQKKHFKIYLQKTRGGKVSVVFFSKKGSSWLSKDEYEADNVEVAESLIRDWFFLL